jgi:hypothetical protein
MMNASDAYEGEDVNKSKQRKHKSSRCTKLGERRNITLTIFIVSHALRHNEMCQAIIHSTRKNIVKDNYSQTSIFDGKIIFGKDFDEVHYWRSSNVVEIKLLLHNKQPPSTFQNVQVEPRCNKRKAETTENDICQPQKRIKHLHATPMQHIEYLTSRSS